MLSYICRWIYIHIYPEYTSDLVGTLYIYFVRHLYLFIERVVPIYSMTFQNYFLLNLLLMYIFVRSIFVLILFLDDPISARISFLHTEIYILLL